MTDVRLVNVAHSLCRFADVFSFNKSIEAASFEVGKFQYGDSIIVANNNLALAKKLGNSDIYTKKIIAPTSEPLFSNERGHSEIIKAISSIKVSTDKINVAVLIGESHFVSWLPAFYKCNIQLVLFLDCTADLLAMNITQLFALRDSASYGEFLSKLESSSVGAAQVFEDKSLHLNVEDRLGANFEKFKQLINNFIFIALQADISDVARITELSKIIMTNDAQIIFLNLSNLHHYMAKRIAIEYLENKQPEEDAWEITESNFLTSVELLAASEQCCIAFSRVDNYTEAYQLLNKFQLVANVVRGIARFLTAITEETQRINEFADIKLAITAKKQQDEIFTDKQLLLFSQTKSMVRVNLNKPTGGLSFRFI